MNKKAEVNEILQELTVLKKRGNEAWDWYDDALNDSQDGGVEIKDAEGNVKYVPYSVYIDKNDHYRYFQGFEDFYIDRYDHLMDELYLLDPATAEKMGYEGHLGEE